MAEELSEIDQRMLAAIDAHWKEHYTAPSLREIAARLGYRSISFLSLRVVQLKAAGHLMAAPNALARQIVPLWVEAAIKAAKVPIRDRKPDDDEQAVDRHGRRLWTDGTMVIADNGELTSVGWRRLTKGEQRGSK